MSKSSRKSDKQLSIFEYLQSVVEQQSADASTEGTFRIADKLRAAMRAAIKGCTLSVHQIAGEMSHLVGESITSDMIYSWTRESDELNGRPNRHIPAEWLPAFCKATGSNEPLIVMGQMVGLFILPGPEALRAEIQKLNEQIHAAKEKRRRRLAFLKEMEGSR